MHDFHRLDVWRLSRQLAAGIYEATDSFPKKEIYGLAAQMRRAAVSVASNIAEGAARGTRSDFRRFLRMASGSAGELETQIFICLDIGLIQDEGASALTDRVEKVRRMLHSLERSFR